jgi:pimeloyl-ACP methyl ester carboxylesterase
MFARRCTLSARSALRALLLLTVVATLALAGSARADIPWSPCTTLPAGYQCGSLGVPLDRSGAVPGSVTLAAARVPAASNPTRSAVVGLAGGPGQAAMPLAAQFAETMQAALANRDLLVFDQRGTGASGALRCSALTTAVSTLQIGSGCANELGASRAFYRTPDSVEDLEALRVAGGYEKLVLFGVSYGTKVALAYAAAHPDRVEALVLDSVVLPEGPDVLRRTSLAAIPRVLRDLCAARACVSATPGVNADLKRLTARLRRHALRGSVVSSTGRRVEATLNQTGLLRILLAGDLNPTLRSELPGSMRDALRGDATPLLRLSARSVGLTNGMQSPPDADSNALFLTTTCEEAPFPWTRGAGVQQRARELDAAARAIPKAQLGAFSPSAVLQVGVAGLCLGWPTASPAPAAPGPLPPVPTLVVDGQMDLRTPYEDAVQVAQRIPGAQVVEIPYTGHSTLGSDQSSCSAAAVAAFFGGQPVQPCAAALNPFAPTPRPPSTLDSVKPAAGVPGLAGRTLAAVSATATDARLQVLGEVVAQGELPTSVGGLRAGTVRATVTDAVATFHLRGYSYVPGVTVTGTFVRTAAGSTGTLTVGGPRAAHGSLHVSASGAVSGRLGGRRITVSAASGRRHDALPDVVELLAQSRIGRSG